MDERVVLYREEPGAGMPVKGTDARVLGRRAAGPDGPLTGQRRASLQAAQGTCWRCSSLWTWGACEGSWRGSCPEASAAWPWCSCTHTRECGLAGGAGGRWASGWAGSSAALGRHRRWAQHEQQVGALARELGFTHVSLSSEAMPMVRIVPRGHTACADAYLTPTIQRYVQGFRRGFQGQLKVRPPAGPPWPPPPCAAPPLTAHLPAHRTCRCCSCAPMVAWRPWTPSVAPALCSRALLGASLGTQPPPTGWRVAILSSALTWEV